MKSLQGVSLFSSAGIAETYYKDIGINIVLANELLEKRVKLYKHLYPKTNVICGNIQDKNIKAQILSNITDDIKLLVATPPCQGLSSVGKNKTQKAFESDKRNFLIFDVFEIIDNTDFDYILIENVPRFLKMYFPYKNKVLLLKKIIELKYKHKYTIQIDILNACDYGIAQSRPRAIIRLFKKELKWFLPRKEPIITLKDVIGHLPSLESGQYSDIPWHFSKKHNNRDILAMKNTPTGQSAFKNDFYYPKKENGDKIKGFHNTYKRMKWNEPAHARTTNSGNIGSHNNVHPGILKEDGTYSDARVLTILETLIVSSLPENWNIPNWATDYFIRTVIGEAIPPLLSKKILEGIKYGE
jgi:DNA (cytosine-5)-methyltransferase 1